MKLTYMPRERISSSRHIDANEEKEVKDELHLLICEGEDLNVSFYKLVVPSIAKIYSLPEDTMYRNYERDVLRYWGPMI